jgi:hypothetical protein
MLYMILNYVSIIPSKVVELNKNLFLDHKDIIFHFEFTKRYKEGHLNQSPILGMKTKYLNF